MTEKEIDNAYCALIDEVNIAFTDKMGIEPCIKESMATLLGCEDSDCDVSYSNLPFDIEFVKLFIESMTGII